MHKLSLAAAALSIATALAAEEPLEINNIYPISNERFSFGDQFFFTQDNQGAFEVVKGPATDGPVRCIGSGFVFRDGTNTVEGICIFGKGEDTFTISWKSGEKGAANDWQVRAGTGRYKGMTGSGIATTGIDVVYKAMPLQKTHMVGTVDIPGK